ncbi:MAG: amidohydrolase family protein [Lysobacteraceae bacterium]
MKPARTALPLALLALALSPAVGAATVLHCGALFDPDEGTRAGPHTVVVDGDRITAVERGHSRPDGADVVDLAGLTCSPGWIDLHVHLGTESGPGRYVEGFRLEPEHFAFRSVNYARRTLEAGFTTVRDMGGELALPLRDAINEGTLPGPHVIAAGRSIATTGGHADPSNGMNRRIRTALGTPGPTEGVVNGPDEARQAVRQRYQDGSDTIKITATGGVLSYARSGDGPQFTVEEIEAIVATARDYGYVVAAHAHGREGIRRAIVGGVDTIEHGTYMDDELFALMRRHGTWYVPTISAGRFVQEKSRIDGYYPEIVRPKAATIGGLIQDTLGRAHRAGVKIAFGTDAGVSYHGDNAEEFVFMVEAGMTPLQALRAATASAAEALRMQEEIGRIRPGLRADVIAIHGDPVADIQAVREVRFVMKSGRVERHDGPPEA